MTTIGSVLRRYVVAGPTAALLIGTLLCFQALADETTVKFRGRLQQQSPELIGWLLGTTVGVKWVFDHESEPVAQGSDFKSYRVDTLGFTARSGVVGYGGPGIIIVANNSNGEDSYTVRVVECLVGDAFGNRKLSQLQVKLVDYDGTVFTDTQLPSTLPDLNQFEIAEFSAEYSPLHRPVWSLESVVLGPDQEHPGPWPLWEESSRPEFPGTQPVAPPDTRGGGFPHKVLIALLLLAGFLWWLRRG